MEKENDKQNLNLHIIIMLLLIYSVRCSCLFVCLFFPNAKKNYKINNFERI